MTQRLVIIGNGMAATRLVEALLARAPQAFTITVVGEEPQHAYNRIQLSPVLGGEKRFAQTLLHPPEWYQRHGVTVLTGEAVIAVDAIARTATTTGRTLAWDALVFATGSIPFIPPIPGADLSHVHAFRTITMWTASCMAAGRLPCWAAVCLASKRPPRCD
ncbi:nitrite reductase [NAD(P)H] large subunit [Citrobacter koseri]|uniref:Nitrite reductase [NAD(P)H] large subunit n=1 Tax=Citrobacter koseri TaxID=545 RepID=A0A447UG92_CITKO|nr:nitrite reductase [NAD(P)H] large subunit [Citrobacter koseri]